MLRIKSEMEHAAKNNEVYHLWWHPHNFGANPESSLAELDELITHFSQLQAEYGFQSKNMRRVGQQIKEMAVTV